MFTLKRVHFQAFIILALIFLPLFAFHNAGFRVQGFSIVKVGSIVIENFEDGSLFFVDNEKRRSGFERIGSELHIDNIIPGSHSILVARPGFWPWTKEVLVREKEPSKVSLLLVPQNSGGLIITNKDPEYYSILEDIRKNRLPQKDNKILSSDGQVEIWFEGNIIFAEWISEEPFAHNFCSLGSCKKIVQVLDSQHPIRNVSFYGDRNDVIIISAQNGVFALEIDNGETQNFQPIYKGTEPTFVPANDKTIYIRDTKFLFQVNI